MDCHLSVIMDCHDGLSSEIVINNSLCGSILQQWLSVSHSVIGEPIELSVGVAKIAFLQKMNIFIE